MRRTTHLAALMGLIALACTDPAAVSDDFTQLAEFDLGDNPHQISFSEDGRTAYVAIAGEDRIAVVDRARMEPLGFIDAPGTPLGVIPLPNGTDLAIARFVAGGVARYTRQGTALGGDRGTGAGASLITGPFAGDRYLVSVEQADSVHVFDASAFTFVASYPTGSRPFPGAATSDGRLAFVPGYADGSVTVIDLFNDRVVATVPVGKNPSGGVVLPGDIDYASVVRGDNRIAFINTASRMEVGELTEGIGASPFSFVLSPNGRLGFVNNTEDDEGADTDIAERRVIDRIPTPEYPIVMAVHPSGEELWVATENADRVAVYAIPDRWRDDARNRPAASTGTAAVTPVAVMGMTHSAHETSEVWGLAQVEETIRSFAPDVLCTEIAPDRWDRIERDLRDRNVIEDPRVLRFPEYRDLILRLSVELGFRIEPCAGWTREMSDLRQTRIARFENHPDWSEARAEYARRLSAFNATDDMRRGLAPDDPRYIHSDAYDARQKGRLALYDEYQNDMIGPGGWTNINVEHYRQVDRTIRAHRGSRVLITFGGGHKYWLLERLRARTDVELLELTPYLPG